MSDKIEMSYDEYKAETETKPQNRLRSWAVWVAVAGLISVVFSRFHVWQYIGIDAAGFEEIVTAVGFVLAAFGIVNNPTNKGGF